jgi:hypothetical protein
MRQPVTTLLAALVLTMTPLAVAPTASAEIVGCGSANGYQVSAESDTTSCQFALAVARKFPARFAGNSTSVVAASPVTGKNYEVACKREYQTTIECTTYSTGVVIYLNN